MTGRLHKKKINIAIDGYSSCGKSTLAKALAEKLNYLYIDTGAMYRAVALYALENDLLNKDQLDKEALIRHLDRVQVTFKKNPETNHSDTLLNGKNVEKEIRQMKVSRLVSSVSSIPEVRKKLVKLQQEMAKKKGVVMDGRDIGTVVLPDAELKLFMTADPEVRAKRRYDELKSKGADVSLEEVRENITQRDYEDVNRKTDPLIRADDAIVIDNTKLTPDEQFKLALSLVQERLD